MSLSINDAQIFSTALKKARKKKHLTQAQCAELLDHSVSFQKDLERCRCSPSIENFYHICRTLDISANDCIFQDQHNWTGSTYQELLRLLLRCNEKALSVLAATASAPADNTVPLNTETGKTQYVEKEKPAVQTGICAAGFLYHAYQLLCYKFQLSGTCIYNSSFFLFLGYILLLMGYIQPYITSLRHNKYFSTHYQSTSVDGY